jgi:hypothetical protein
VQDEADAAELGVSHEAVHQAMIAADSSTALDARNRAIREMVPRARPGYRSHNGSAWRQTGEVRTPRHAAPPVRPASSRRARLRTPLPRRRLVRRDYFTHTAVLNINR